MIMIRLKKMNLKVQTILESGMVKTVNMDSQNFKITNFKHKIIIIMDKKLFLYQKNKIEKKL